MFKRPVTIRQTQEPSPCFNPKTKESCSKRRAGCAVDCKEWAEYVKVRQKRYDKNKTIAVVPTNYKICTFASGKGKRR